jgi:putative transposase
MKLWGANNRPAIADPHDRIVAPHRHLDGVLRTYATHYNRGRPHRALALSPPVVEDEALLPVRPRDVRRQDLLGGLIHEYGGLAA